MQDLEVAIKAIDSVIAQYEDDIPYGALELLFQKRAQDMRVMSLENSEFETIEMDDIEAYS